MKLADVIPWRRTYNEYGEVSPHLQPVVDFLNEQEGVVTAFQDSKYRFQRNADQMLVVRRS
jgi:hypothetical protein